MIWGTLQDWLTLSNRVSIVVLTAGACASAAIIWFGSRDGEVKDGQIAPLGNDAAQARLETEKVKQAVEWRVIPKQNAEALEKALAANPGAVNLRYTDGDPEALFLAVQFSKIFSAAHWQIASGALEFANAMSFGLGLPDSGDAGDALREAFTSAQIGFSTTPLPPQGAAFSIGTIPGAPIFMVGSRFPQIMENIHSN